MTIEQDTFRRAYIHFQHALDELEQSALPLQLDMSRELGIHFASLSSMARIFFSQANLELFAQHPARVPHLQTKGGFE